MADNEMRCYKGDMIDIAFGGKAAGISDRVSCSEYSEDSDELVRLLKAKGLPLLAWRLPRSERS